MPRLEDCVSKSYGKNKLPPYPRGGPAAASRISCSYLMHLLQHTIANPSSLKPQSKLGVQSHLDSIFPLREMRKFLLLLQSF